MALEIFDLASVKKQVAANKLRQFPREVKGRDRLLPYARPALNTFNCPPDSRIFVLGACFGRGIEREFQAAGRTVLSSPTDLGLPGSTFQQFQRYNIFNLDVALNELRWALEADDAGTSAALLPAGNYLVDTQLSWAFAHEPETAEIFRYIYNGTYAAIADADLVVILAGGVEQWFDTKNRIYINTMPALSSEKDAPGRFELHRIGVDEAARTLTQIMDLVRTHSRTKPQFVISVSPVSQPMVYGSDDALVDQFLAKSVQRLAVERVVAETDDAIYLPALEAAMWSDFKYSYMENSPNHTNRNFAARMASDLLAAGGASDLPFLRHRTLAHGSAMYAGGNMSAVIDLCEALGSQAEEDSATLPDLEPDEDGSIYQNRVDLGLLDLHINALGAAHRRPEAFQIAMAHLRAGQFIQHLLQRMPAIGGGVIRPEERSELVELARSHGLDSCALEAMRLAESNEAKARTAELHAIEEVRRAADFNTTLRLSQEFLANPEGLTTRAKARATVPLLLSLLHLDRAPEAVEVAIDALQSPLMEDRAVLATSIRALGTANRSRLVQAIEILEGRVDPVVFSPLTRRLARLDASK